MAIKGQPPSGYAARATEIASTVADGLVIGGIENGTGTAAEDGHILTLLFPPVLRLEKPCSARRTDQINIS